MSMWIVKTDGNANETSDQIYDKNIYKHNNNNNNTDANITNNNNSSKCLENNNKTDGEDDTVKPNNITTNNVNNTYGIFMLNNQINCSNHKDSLVHILYNKE